MTEQKYRVVLEGRLSESADSNQASALLTELLHVSPERAARLLSGRRIPLQQELGKGEAEALCSRLEAAGVPASVEALAELQLEAVLEPAPVPGPAAAPDTKPPAASGGGVEIIEIEATAFGGLAQTHADGRPSSAPAARRAPPEVEPAPASKPPEHTDQASPPEADAGHEQFFDTRAHADWASVAGSAEAAPKRGPSALVLGAGAALVLALLTVGAYLWLGGGNGEAPSVVAPLVPPASPVQPPSEAEQRLRSLARSVKVWMIQFGIGYDPSQVTIGRLRQDMGLQDADLQDPWGTAMRYEPAGAGFRVLSAGPDRHFGSGDDLEVSDKL